jgi:hypothetical protein
LQLLASPWRWPAARTSAQRYTALWPHPIAVNAKIEALTGLQQYGEAIPRANESLVRLQGTLFDGYRSQVYISRGATERAQGQLQLAIEDYTQAVVISWRIQNNRGITDAAGGLAQTLEQRKPTTRAAIRTCGSRSAHEQQTAAEI